MIALLIFTARICGKLQTGLGLIQTHLLTSAQNMGWEPDTQLEKLVLKNRQKQVEARGLLRRATKLRQRQLREQRRLQQAVRH